MKTRNIMKLIAVFLLCFLLQTPTSAQDVPASEEPIQKYAVSWQYSSLFTGGWKLNFEKRLKENQWLSIAPTIYSFPSVSYWWNNNYWDDYNSDPCINSVFGVGIDIGYKYYLDKTEIFYLLGGVNYSYINYKYEVFDFLEFEENGMKYSKYDKTSNRQHFNRPGAVLCLGLHTEKQIGFFLGTYGGVGYRYSIYNDKKESFDDGIFSPGYRGFYFTGGFHIGVAF